MLISLCQWVIVGAINCLERQQQQVLEIERFKRDADRERNEAQRLREEMRDMQVESQCKFCILYNIALFN